MPQWFFKHALVLRKWLNASPVLWAYKKFSGKILFPSNILHNFPCDNKPCHRWYKSYASRNIASFRTFMLRSRRADTICSSAYGHIFDWTCWLFFGVNNFQFFYTSLFQFATHYFCKWTHFGFVNVGYLEGCRIKFVASSHATCLLYTSPSPRD